MSSYNVYRRQPFVHCFFVTLGNILLWLISVVTFSYFNNLPFPVLLYPCRWSRALTISFPIATVPYLNKARSGGALRGVCDVEGATRHRRRRRRGGSCAAAVALRGEAKDGLHGAAWGCTLARTPAGRRERVSRPASAVLRWTPRHHPAARTQVLTACCCHSPPLPPLFVLQWRLLPPISLCYWIGVRGYRVYKKFEETSPWFDWCQAKFILNWSSLFLF